MKKVNWNNVDEATEYEKLPGGGYICRITAVEDFEDKEYLKIEFDISEGVHKGYYRSLYEAKSFWGGNFIRSYKEKALPFFKAFKTAIEQSNSSYIFDEENIAGLRQKLIGVVIGYEEYKAKDDSIKERAYAAEIRSVTAIQKNQFKVPVLKKFTVPVEVNKSVPSDYEDIEVDNADLPFSL